MTARTIDADVFATPEHETMIALADEIRREHALAISSASEAVEHAIKCGQLLREAKASVGHGAWADWLAANFPKSERTARNYMRLAEQKDELPNRQRVADLTVRGALAALSTPTTPKPIAKAPESEPAPAAPALSSREVAILALDGEGFSTPEIAKQMNLSTSTVNAAKRRARNPLEGLVEMTEVDAEVLASFLTNWPPKWDSATEAQRAALAGTLRKLSANANALARRFEVKP